MKLAILQTDHVLKKFSSRFGEYPEMINRLLIKYNRDIECDTFDVTRQCYPKNIGKYDAVIITGSKVSVYEPIPWVEELLAYVANLKHEDTKIIGICFGHQLLAQALGGRTSKSEKGWGVGVHASVVYEQESWMTPELEQYSLLVSHQDQVVSLPENGVRLAGSEFCENSMFRVERKCLAMQGHPEFPLAYAQELLLHRQAIIGEQRVQQAQRSFSQRIDHEIIGQWVLNFIQW